MTQKAKKQLEYAISTHAIENLSPSKDAIRLCEKVSGGTISANEAVATLLNRYTVKRGAIRG